MPKLVKDSVAVSDWQTYELDTTLLDPPVLKLKLRPASALAGVNAGPAAAFSSYLVASAIDAVADWDLTETVEGKDMPVPCTDENKRRLANGLRVLFSRKLKGTEEILAWAVLGYAGDERNFLKN
jgi:hypothetical protein